MSFMFEVFFVQSVCELSVVVNMFPLIVRPRGCKVPGSE